MSPANRPMIEERNLILNGAGDLSYRLTRSLKRKRTMQVSIQRSGTVDVSAPASFSIRTIEEFLQLKSGWIDRKIKTFKEQELLRANRVAGQPKLLYLGEEFPVLWRASGSHWGKIDFAQGGWTIDVPAHVEPSSVTEYIKAFLEKWYKSRAQSVIEERVALHARRMGESPSQIRIRSPKRLWGSCHPVKRVVHFNWKLIMAPVDVLDYVVIHELSHLRVADHSKRFWSLVAKFSPDHGAHKMWLRLNMHRFELSLE